MDLYEFSQLLKRQSRLLLIGAIVVVVAVLVLGFEVGDDGIEFRAGARYESSIQVAVVPSDFESLATTFAGARAIGPTATLYATLLSSPEAADAISEESGVRLLSPLTVVASGDDGYLRVTAEAATPEGARAVALYSFEWLERRLAESPSIVRLDGQSGASPLDESGRFVSSVRVQASPAFANTATDLWVEMRTAEAAITTSLADVGVVASEFVAVLTPETEMVVSLQDIFGAELDTISVMVPPIPTAGSTQYALDIRLDRGLLLYPGADGTGDPQLLERHINLSWRPTAEGVGQTIESIGLVLLTDDPVAAATGTRRGPILILGALVGGLLALLMIAVVRDTWTRERTNSELGQTLTVVNGDSETDDVASPPEARESQ